jgi:hypothetical protein
MEGKGGDMVLYLMWVYEESALKAVVTMSHETPGQIMDVE